MSYTYKTEVPNSGDSLTVAAHQLAHDVESYLYDTDHEGYRALAYLDFAVGRFSATKSSSGLVGNHVHWDPAALAIDVKRPRTGPSGEHDRGLRYSDEALADPSIDTTPDVPSTASKIEAWRIANGYPVGTQIVLDPNDASKYNGAVVVANLNAADGDGPVQDDEVEGAV